MPKSEQNGLKLCQIKRERIQEQNQAEEQYFMIVRSIIREDESKNSIQNHIVLNEKLMKELQIKIDELNEVSSKLNSQVSGFGAQLTKGDQGLKKELEDQLKEHQITINKILKNIEIERSGIVNFNLAFQRFNTETIENTENSVKMVNEKEGLLIENQDETKMGLEISSKPRIQVFDCRKFLVDPDYQEEYSNLKMSVKHSRKTEHESLPKNFGSGGSFGNIAFGFKKLPSIELPKVIPGILKLINENGVYRQYPLTSTGEVRTSLPSERDPNSSINVWGILKENVGNDFDSFEIPIYLREPLSSNQRIAGWFEYAHLLRQANQSKDDYLQLSYVVSFFVMTISQNMFRLKPGFDSLLGETFEYEKEDLRILVETVSILPQIQAFYAESDDFLIEGNFRVKADISVAGITFEPLENFHLQLKSNGKTYIVQKPLVSLHNYIFGEMYFWLKSDLIVTETTSNLKAVAKFKPKGWSSKSDYEFSVQLIDNKGTSRYSLNGKWNECVFFESSTAQSHLEIAKVNSIPARFEFQYHFSSFLIDLNHLTIQLAQKIAPTDSRFRPDVRAYENGNFELASFENFRLLEKQSKSTSNPLTSNWFMLSGSLDALETKYKGGYFECRAKSEWPGDLSDIYGGGF